jgi:electron transport complex protein RnfG
MAKLQSSFKNMVLSLTCIALIAAGALAGVFMMTQDTIEDEKQKKQQNAIMEVLPQIEGIKIAEVDTIDGLILHKAYVGDKWVGTAVETSTDGNKNMPFGGTFKLMVGFDKVGNVVNYVVLEQAETPGLGALMASWFKNADKPGQNIIGKNPATTNFTVSKDGGEIDAITASTITSRAFLEAVVKAYNSIAQQPMPIEAVSNATQVKIPTTDVAEGACPYGNDPTTCPGCSEKHCQKKGGQQ